MTLRQLDLFPYQLGLLEEYAKEAEEAAKNPTLTQETRQQLKEQAFTYRKLAALNDERRPIQLRKRLRTPWIFTR